MNIASMRFKPDDVLINSKGNLAIVVSTLKISGIYLLEVGVWMRAILISEEELGSNVEKIGEL